MKWEEIGEQPCSVARTLSVLGDRWTMLILRNAFMGIRRFGAMMNARSAAEGIAMSDNPALKPLQNMMLTVELPAYKVQREKGKPVVWFTGDSTVKNTDKDKTATGKKRKTEREDWHYEGD
jgi:hypothetical protein